MSVFWDGVLPRPRNGRAGSETQRAASAIRVAPTGRMALARVDGPLDGENGTALLQRLLPLCGRARRVVLDLRRADFVDSAGVRALMQVKKAVEAAGGELRL